MLQRFSEMLQNKIKSMLVEELDRATPSQVRLEYKRIKSSTSGRLFIGFMITLNCNIAVV